MTAQQKFYMLDACINNIDATAKAIGIDTTAVAYRAFMVILKNMRTQLYEEYNGGIVPTNN